MRAKIACVLRSGDRYTPDHVLRLAEQVNAYSSDTEVLCLTDLPGPSISGAVAVPMRHRWPGWFSKLEMLAQPGPLLYLDLDLTIIGDIMPLLSVAERHDFVACKSFWRTDPNALNSSVMAWRATAPRVIYETFLQAPEVYMREYSCPENWGDQDFIRDHTLNMAFWQMLLPGTIVHYRRVDLFGEDMSNCRVLVSQKYPRPWDDGGSDEWLRSVQRRDGVPHHLVATAH